MNETELIPDERKNGIISNSASWFITCIFVSMLPFILSYVYNSLSQQEFVSVSPYLEDILLIVFPVSCSIFALAFDSFKIIDKKYKKLLFIFGGLFAILSLGYYIFLTGLSKEKQNYEDNISIIVSFVFIAICTLIGCLSHKNHDKNYEIFRQSINNKYKDLLTKYDMINQKYNDLVEKYEKLKAKYAKLKAKYAKLLNKNN